jgi:hypothetical protein
MHILVAGIARVIVPGLPHQANQRGFTPTGPTSRSLDSQAFVEKVGVLIGRAISR